MNLDDQISLGHFLLNDRTCKVCGETKNLVEGFYRTRKDKGSVPSSYAYECKECTKKRVLKHRKQYHYFKDWQYPDWQSSRPNSPSEKIANNK